MPCRLIYAEADGFPGLIVDSYDAHLVVQVHHAGIARLFDLLLDLLHQLLTPKSITLRNDSEVRRLEGLPLEVQVISGQVPEAPGRFRRGRYNFWWMSGMAKRPACF